MNDVLEQLRAADPAKVGARYTEEEVRAHVAEIVRSDTADARPPRLRRPFVRRALVATVSIAAVSAAAIAADVVTWPWSHGGAESIAYGVTKQGDGSVEVRAHWADVKDPAALQAQLRAAGVPVSVLVESPSGACDEPRQDGTRAGASVIDVRVDRSGPQKDDAFILRPALLPPGSTVVIALPFPGEVEGSFVGLWVTDQKPPTCIPQSQMRGPAVPAPDTVPTPGGPTS